MHLCTGDAAAPGVAAESLMCILPKVQSHLDLAFGQIGLYR